MNPKVDAILSKAKAWKEEMGQLRSIALSCGLAEELKWGVPCYTYEGANIIVIHGFKEYCALLFFKGAILKDPKGILIQQTKNVQAARQIRFTNVREIIKMQSTLKSYIKEATQIEKAGLKVNFKTTSEFKMPQELHNQFNKDFALKKAFKQLTPGRQRGYILYFSAAKQTQTRQSRIEKYRDHILNGKGLHD